MKYEDSDEDNGVLDALGLSVGDEIDGEDKTNHGGKATMIKGQNAKITLNGVAYTNSHNTFDINGLTITANSKTNEKITLTTQQDTDGIYDMIKDFLKTYNEVINEMDKLYNAEAAKDYEPLSDDEKSSMSDTEVEKYEQKIKDSLLRRDSSISAISTELKKIMMSGFSVNGKTMVLASFGIETMDYFSAPDNERNAYHIYGDKDDSDFADKTDKLKAMIASDPDAVVSFFSQLTQSLYTEMNRQSKAVEGYRSFGYFYDDKKMKSDYDDYKSKIKDEEKKLADYEDKWYKKFAAILFTERQDVAMALPSAYAQYNNSKILTASPAELTLMLYEGAIKFCNIAIVAVEQKDIEKAHNNIIKTERIIDYFRQTLDMKYPVAQDFERV